MNLRTTLGISFFVAAISAVALKFLPLPYVWIGLACVAVLAYLFRRSTTPAKKLGALYVATVLIVLTGFEAFLFSTQQKTDFRRSEFRDADGAVARPHVKHAFLGHAPTPSQTITWKRFFGDELWFDVKVNIGSDGLRVSAPASPQQSGDCVLFFGGSFTYGWGVNDVQTLPYRVGSGANGRFAIYNFADNGWGPHQMLAAVEHGIVKKTIECQPRYAIYQGVPEHVNRVSGKVTWSSTGPKYRLDDNGFPAYSGQFDDPHPNAVIEKIVQQLQKSLLFRRLARRKTQSDVDLLIAIINRARIDLEQSYPRLEFHVIFWDKPDIKYSTDILLGLHDAGLKVHSVSEILPDYASAESRHLLINDNHPNTLAYAAIAEFVLDNIIADSPD